MANKRKKWVKIGCGVIITIIVSVTVIAFIVHHQLKELSDFQDSLEKPQLITVNENSSAIDSIYGFYNKKAFKEAYDCLVRLEEQGRADSVEPMIRAEIYAINNEADKGLGIIRSSIDSLSGGNPNAHYYFNTCASIYSIKGDDKNAIKYYKRSLEINPYYERPLIGLAATYEKLGDKERALEAYSKALELFENANTNHRFDSEIEYFSNRIEELK